MGIRYFVTVYILMTARRGFRKAPGRHTARYYEKVAESRRQPTFDQDGDLDIFVGGRVVPGEYPLSPRSARCCVTIRAMFVDVTDRVAPSLREVGLVTGAIWSDANDDGQSRSAVNHRMGTGATVPKHRGRSWWTELMKRGWLTIWGGGMALPAATWTATATSTTP